VPGTSEDEDHERWTVTLPDGDQVNFDPEKMGRVVGERTMITHTLVHHERHD